MKKKIVLIAVVIMSLIAITMIYQTFATDSTTNDNVYDLTLSGSTEDVLIPAGTSKTIMYQITNTNKGVVQYGVAYKGKDISIKDISIIVDEKSDDSSSGRMDYGESKFVKLLIRNTGTNDSIVTLKAILGYENGGKLIVPEGYSLAVDVSKITVSGQPPFNIYSAGNSLINYKIYGNSVQNGVPTPEAPIEVESVGEKTKNLLPDDVLDVNSYVYDYDNTYKSVYKLSFLIPNKTYTISFDYNKTSGVAYYYLMKHVDGTNSVEKYLLTNSSNSQRVVYTFTPQENVDYYFYGNNTSYLTNALNDISNFQIEENTFDSGYVPYKGYSIPIKVRGKNLFNIMNINSSLVTRGYIEYIDDYNGFLMKSTNFTNGLSIGKFSTICPDLKVGDSFRINFDTNAIRNNVDVTYFYLNKFGGSIFEGRTYVCTQEMLDSNVYAYSGGVEGAYIKNIQLQIGDVITQYEPYKESVTSNIYLDEPLRKIGDYADYIDFENGKVVRKIKARLLNGSESWTKDSTGIYMTLNDLIKLSNYTTAIISNKLVTAVGHTSSTNLAITGYIDSLDRYANQNWLYYKNSSLTTASEVKSWFTENPTYVYYVLATPIEESIELPTIPTHMGTTIIEVDTDIQPSNMEITYKGI